MDESSETAYAQVQEFAASWAEFRSLSAAVYQPAPPGLLVHLAGPTDEGVRVISVWDSETSWRRFQDEQLEPVREALSGSGRTLPTTRDLHAQHIVLGSGNRPRNIDQQGGNS